MSAPPLSGRDTVMTDDALTHSLPPRPSPNPPSSQQPANPNPEPKYGGFTRFEIELEFIQSLASPLYIQQLASQKYLENPAFIAYLEYLQYFARPPYTAYLTYPGPTLKHLELLQQPRFRADVLSPDVVQRLCEEGARAGVAWHAR